MSQKQTAPIHPISAFLRKCWIPLAILIISIAIIVTLFRALTPWAAGYKGDVETHLSNLLGQKVTVKSMETTWYWLEPVIKLNNIAIADPEGHTLELNKLLISFNILSSLQHWQIKPGTLYIDDVNLSIKKRDSGWHIDGISHLDPQVSSDKDMYSTLLSWLSTQHRVQLRNVSALLHLQDGSLIPLKNLNLSIKNNGDNYQLQGTATLTQTTPTEISMQANLNINPNSFSDTKGELYLKTTGFMPAQWQGFLKNPPIHIEGGHGDMSLWLTVAKGKIDSWQSQLNFEHLAWQRTNHQRSQLIQSIKANLGWKHSDRGWKLSSDDIQLRADGVSWPKNTLHIDHQNETYKVFLQHLLIEPILATDITWPYQIKQLIALHPTGAIHDTQITIQQDKVNYLLSRFDDLGWLGNKSMPAVNGISGAIYWQPDEGRLELESNDTVVQPHGLTPINFSTVSAAADWKKLSHGLRISLSNFVLINPDLAFTSSGVIDEPENPAASHINLVTKVSAKNVEKWLDYLPSSNLKPKLDHWLKHDIKHIGQLNGKVKVNGSLADFPFDKGDGEFSILSHLSNTDIAIGPGWPLCRNTSGYIRVNKRNLSADVTHANFKNVPIDNMNIRIDDIGHDHESLLLHTKIGAPAEAIKSYIFASPLKKPLSRLNPLDFNGLLGLDLQLEVPFYPADEGILSRGVITFNNNKAILHHDLNSIELRNITGSLDFNTTGIVDSSIKASLAGNPISMHIKSHKTPVPLTEVSIKGHTSIDTLRNQFKSPIFTAMKGHADIFGKLSLTDNPHDLDHLNITTSLRGVAIDLPQPLVKPAATLAPLTMDINFNPNKAVRLRFNYDNRLSSDLWFEQQSTGLNLDKGEIRVGSGHAVWQKQPGIQIVGSLPAVNLSQWHNSLSKFPLDQADNSFSDKLQFIDLKLGRIRLLNHIYPNVSFKASKLTDKRWAIQLKQQNIEAELRYEPNTNTLTGNLPRLYLSKSIVADAEKDSHQSHLSPANIPNLNLAIEKLKLDDIDIGSVSLRSVSSKTSWALQEGEITSPTYELNMTGEWAKYGSTNHTNMKSYLKVSNLGRALNQWNINPAVEAKSGELQFNGGWPGSIADFSLSKIHGQMEISIKDGRITHLTPEAEQKIGLGKLLSILSLQTIPRRLKLDFSDLAKPGYSFDRFNGNFKIKNGIMNTTDSYIEGPIAYATMKGNLNLSKQLYDLDLHVSPHITASLPVVATIAGGPIAGIATWVASKIISNSMQQVSGYTYKITGPWMEPIVQQLHIFHQQKQNAS